MNSIFLVTSVSAQGTEGKPDAIPRFGAVIDRYEWLYFGLFPGIPDFASAEPAPDTANGLSFAIKRKAHPDTLLTLDSAHAGAFRTYIDRYETLLARYKSGREPDSLFLHCARCIIDTLRKARLIQVYGGIVEETTPVRAGSELEIFPIATVDTILIAQSGSGAYEWRRSVDSLIFITPSAMSALGIRADIWDYALVGAFAGFGAGSALASNFTAHGNTSGMAAGLDGIAGGIILGAPFGVLIGTIIASGITDWIDTTAGHRVDSFLAHAGMLRARSVFRTFLPPELSGLLRERYGIKSVRADRPFPEIAASNDTPRVTTRIFLDDFITLYPTITKSLGGAHFGGRYCVDVPIEFVSSRTMALIFRPDAGVGLYHYQLGLALKIQFRSTWYVVFSAHYLHLTEEFGWHWYDYQGPGYRNEKEGIADSPPWTNVYPGVGFGWDFSRTALEISYRASIDKPFYTDISENRIHAIFRHAIHVLTLSLGFRL